MKAQEIPLILQRFRRASKRFTLPSVSQIALPEKNRPFRVLISCLLSLRTKDQVTFPASERLFARAKTPEAMEKLEPLEIQKIIYPVGFYRTKAKLIPEICRTLIREYRGLVPDEIDELLKFKGVGRKTANLVVSVGYGKPGICVDTHVHRISNRLGLVKTKDPHATEFALRKILPKR